MKIIYALEDLPNIAKRSIFLAGPIPRDPNVPSWRPEALNILEQVSFSGTVFTPERRDEKREREYDNQIAWEWEAMQKAKVIVFWIPRNLETMPAFTTNIEWGRWYESGKVVLGYPEETPKMSYFRYCCEVNKIPLHNDLKQTLLSAVRILK